MLRKILKDAIRKTNCIREMHWTKYLSNIKSEGKEENVAPRIEDIKYIFREVRNESVISNFCSGRFNPKLLKMPDSDNPDTLVRGLINKLADIDLSNYETGKLNLKQLGIFGAFIPKQYGGLGLNSAQFSYLMQHEKLIDWTLVLIAHQNLCSQALLLYGSDEQKSYYLPKLASGELLGAFCLTETSSGSDMFSMETIASLSPFEDGYLLQGTKNWVINGHAADVYIVFAMTKDSIHEGGRDYITALIVDRCSVGVKIGEKYNIDWLENCEVADISFNETFIPIDKVLDEANGGYKIANHIQNNARFIVAACISGITRYFMKDLITRKSNGLIPKDSLIDHLMNECITYLYAIESGLYFTTRFSDSYLIPEIELESAAIKVFSIESGLKLMKNFQNIYLLLDRFSTPKFQKLFHRVNGLQSFLGSNYFVKLYIGGTMVKLSTLNMMENQKKMRQPWNNIPWMKDVLKDSLEPIHWTEDISKQNYVSVLKYSLFLSDLRNIFRKLQMAKFSLARAIKLHENKTLEYQNIMVALSNLGEMFYILSTCVARSNTTFGDFEIKCTEKILQKTHSVIDESLKMLQLTLDDPGEMLLHNLSSDIALAKGYPPHDILEMRRDLAMPVSNLLSYDEFYVNKID